MAATTRAMALLEVAAGWLGPQKNVGRCPTSILEGKQRPTSQYIRAYFIPEWASPSITLRWSMMNSTKIGAMAIRLAAMSAP